MVGALWPSPHCAPGHRAALGGKSAADREGRVAVGHQRGDEQLAAHLAELEDLQAARDQAVFPSGW